MQSTIIPIWFTIALCLCFLSNQSAAASGDVLIYPVPQPLESSIDFKVRGNGKNVFVQNAGSAAFAAFSLENNATVKVTYHAGAGIEKWQLKPFSYRTQTLHRRYGYLGM